MKVTVGGSMGWKIQGKQYESIDASSVFTIEKEVPDDVKFEAMEEMMDKTTKALEKDATKKMKSSIEQYKTKVEEYKKILHR